MAVCRRCHDFAVDEDLKHQITQHVERIPVELRTEQVLYSQRLMMCDGCSGLKNGMCMYCGCFVVVRAAKKHSGCPKPYEDQWGSLA